MTSDSAKPKTTFAVQIKRRDGSIDVGDVTEAPPTVVAESADDHQDLGGTACEAVARCIYCGATEGLTREHVVPFGLSGTSVIPNGSCKACSKITGAFEGSVLRGPMRDVRKILALQSRSKHRDVPDDAELILAKAGIQKTVRVPLADFPSMLMFPNFSPPRHLTGSDEPGIGVRGVMTVLFGPPPTEVIKRFDADTLIVEPRPSEPVAFARMLAKIAYCFAVFQRAASPLPVESFVLPAILGSKDDIGQWVGTLDGPIRKFPGVLHRLELHNDVERGLVIAEIQLFAHSETPSYGVILGRLPP